MPKSTSKITSKNTSKNTSKDLRPGGSGLFDAGAANHAPRGTDSEPASKYPGTLLARVVNLSLENCTASSP
jgi:hypothetical protein